MTARRPRPSIVAAFGPNDDLVDLDLAGVRAVRSRFALVIATGVLAASADPLDVLVALRNAITRDGVVLVAERDLDVGGLAEGAGFTRVRVRTSKDRSALYVLGR